MLRRPRDDQHPSPSPTGTGTSAGLSAGISAGIAADGERIRRARAGDATAVAELYAEHRPVALRVAARLCRPGDVDDVVAEAFVRVLDLIGRGGGPQTSFRAYLLTAVRHAATDLARAEARCAPSDLTDDLGAATGGTTTVPAREDAGSDRQVESHVLARALTTLPPRWQLAVWWADVEERSMSEIGADLGLNANAAAALAFRAREGLRNAYLAQYLDGTVARGCVRWRAQLPALVRGRLGSRTTEGVLAHLSGCRSCADAAETLRGVLVAAG